MTRQQRRGFTLVELLVVISIIALLMALLLPAVQGAIQNARQATCLNNMRETGRAILIREGAKTRFPGWVNEIGPFEASWAVAIMPELDRNDTFDLWQSPRDGSNIPFSDANFDIDSWLEVATPGIDVLTCPVDPQPKAGGEWLSYVVNTGMADDLTVTNAEDLKAHGLFFDRQRIPQHSRISSDLGYVASNDGSTLTLMLGENVAAVTWLGWHPFSNPNPRVPSDCDPTSIDPAVKCASEFALGFTWSSAPLPSPNPNGKINECVCASGFPPFKGFSTLKFFNSSISDPPPPVNPTNHRSVLCNPFQEPATRGNCVNNTRFTSNHPGGVNAIFADGHGTFLSEQLDKLIYELLCTPAGRLSDPDRNGVVDTVQIKPLEKKDFDPSS